ncbi:hypothetical protein E2C01_084646 [Portunus trituberculatus]|uniref:Uncharacterized protein n=1 Tax=Portunus trituberculatus TaxID=210409 RepID=A0A5B7IYU8_PORTR|nr:hypothetical protein [Portunus trituberculatus]
MHTRESEQGRWPSALRAAHYYVSTAQTGRLPSTTTGKVERWLHGNPMRHRQPHTGSVTDTWPPGGAAHPQSRLRRHVYFLSHVALASFFFSIPNGTQMREDAVCRLKTAKNRSVRRATNRHRLVPRSFLRCGGGAAADLECIMHR